MLGQAESVLLCMIVASAVNISLQLIDENERVRDYFEGPDGYNKRAEMLSNKYSITAWAYYTNITSHNEQKLTEMSLLWSEFAKNESARAKEFNLNAVTNASLRRQLDAILDVGISGYEDKDVLKQIAEIGAEMTGVYSTAEWCKTETNCLSLEPELTDLITISRDYEELAEAWKGWRDVSGAKMRTQYEKYVELMNLAIKAEGKYEDMGDYYRSWYEDPNFETDVRNLFVELSPLYDNLHAYVRKKLREHYGADKFPTEGHIPAHIFGNMWAQQWGNIYDLLEPYPNHGSESITEEMVNQNYNITHMYRLSEDFFESLGMKPMPDSFWELSMLEKPSDGRNVVCHASAWDFSNGTDFRRDYEELAEAWKGWRDVSGAKMRTQYEKYVELMNLAIKAEGKYEDMGDYYRSWYEDPNFETDVRNLFVELSPLYDNLHAYVRKKLREHYGADKFPTEGHIPAHIFGNMWAQQWGNIYDLLEPYPNHGSESITEEMVNQNYNITHMYRLSEDFFESLGMKPMPDSFWELSMLEKPSDGRNVVCHASAWDFSNGTDFRIKQCTTVTQDQLNAIHHEMGHIQYFFEYINQPYLFRGGANPGFHEGIAEIVSLSFQTPEHLQKIGLLENLPTGIEGDINFLFSMALEKVAFLPFGYLVDQWRWSVYRGETTPANYNKAWWDLRCKYQGISPPVQRSENDFDPGAKYHIPDNTPYIRFFVSFVLHFQWHQALCELAGHNGSLHRCDIYESKDAGQRLREMLQMGASEPWGEAMFTLTRGTSAENRKMSAKPMLDYFKPLQEWLEAQNAGETIGWDKNNCPSGSFVTPVSSAPQNSSNLMSISLIISIVYIIRNLLFN